jgi:hypothetical protein
MIQTTYIEMARIYEDQEELAAQDNPSGTSHQFTNIHDKGYRLTLAAMKSGQTILQPIFAQSDQQFTRGETIHSACVAVIRLGNERAVKRAKMSMLIQQGPTNRHTLDLEMLADVWLAWGFQIIFMYSNNV